MEKSGNSNPVRKFIIKNPILLKIKKLDQKKVKHPPIFLRSETIYYFK